MTRPSLAGIEKRAEAALIADCDQAWPCATRRALATHLDLTDPEGDPT